MQQISRSIIVVKKLNGDFSEFLFK